MVIVVEHVRNTKPHRLHEDILHAKTAHYQMFSQSDMNLDSSMKQPEHYILQFSFILIQICDDRWPVGILLLSTYKLLIYV